MSIFKGEESTQNNVPLHAQESLRGRGAKWQRHDTITFYVPMGNAASDNILITFPTQKKNENNNLEERIKNYPTNSHITFPDLLDRVINHTLLRKI